MKIAAGIILIIAAIINVFAGAGWVLGGAAATGAGMIVDAAAKQAGTEGTVSTEDAAKVADAVGTAKGAGTGLMIFGLFLWVMFVLQIVCAIMLFMAKAKGLVLVVGALSVIAEIVGIVLTTFGWTNAVGIVGGVLAIIAAMGYAKATSAPAAPAAAA